MRFKFFMQSIIGCDSIISDLRDIKVFMELVIGDIERMFCDFALDNGLEGLDSGKKWRFTR
jgi:hypothetical protein